MLSFYNLDIDECDVSPPCDDNASCTNTEGSFECECKIGFTGDGWNCSGINNKDTALLFTIIKCRN